MVMQPGTPTSGGRLAPKASDEDHHTDGQNWSDDAQPPIKTYIKINI